jgi:hypothetical protein
MGRPSLGRGHKGALRIRPAAGSVVLVAGTRYGLNARITMLCAPNPPAVTLVDSLVLAET